MKDEFGRKTLESMRQAEWYNDWVLEQIKEFIYGEILEIGSGIGTFTETLQFLGKVTATDINDDYLSQLEKRFPKIESGFGDIEKGQFFFKDKTFNSIVCLNVIEHIKDDSKAFVNLVSLLAKGGYLVLIVPSNPSLFGEIDKAIGHYRRYDKSKLVTRLDKLGLQTIKAKRVNFLGGLGWWIAGKILRQKIVEQNNIRIFNILAPLFLSFEKLIEFPIGTSVLVIGKKK